jgi:glycosyltransferase involved in cell wall biosynthesis
VVSVPRRGRVLFTTFGWDGPGGGTILPRQLAIALLARGWSVAALAAGGPYPSLGPYGVRRVREDGVDVTYVHNRPSAILDVGYPERDLRHEPIERIFRELLDRFTPDIVHWHNLHNLGASLTTHVRQRGIRNVLSTHNLWTVCARSHLERADRGLCYGPADAGRICASCTGEQRLGEAYERRLAEMKRVLRDDIDEILAVSGSVARSVASIGVPRSKIKILRQSLPVIDALWSAHGQTRRPGRRAKRLQVGFVGSGRTHKGAHLLAAAARLLPDDDIHFYGSFSPASLDRIHAAGSGAVNVHGSYQHDGLGSILAELDCVCAPAMIWDSAPFAVQEALAARVPVIGAAMGGIPELVQDGVNGLIIEPRSVDAIVKAISRFRDEPDLLARLQTGISEPIRWPSYVDAIEAAYRGNSRTLSDWGKLCVAWPDAPPELMIAARDASDIELHPYAFSPHVPDVLVAGPRSGFGSDTGLFIRVRYDPGCTQPDAGSARPDAAILRTAADIGQYLALGLRPDGVYVSRSPSEILRSLRLIGGRSQETCEVRHQ